MLYLKSFELNPIRSGVQTQKNPESRATRENEAVGVSFREISFKQFIRLNQNQLQKCRSHQALSIGIKLNEIRQ